MLCEKPLANTVAEAEADGDAAARAAAQRGGVRRCVDSPTGERRRSHWPGGWSRTAGWRRSGTCVRSTCRTGSRDPDAPMTWRLDKAKSGSGALGDIGAHIVDTAQWLTGQSITGVSAITGDVRDVSGRWAASGPDWAATATSAPDAPRGEVTVRRRRVLLGPVRRRRDLGIFEATRFALGRKNALADRDQRHRPAAWPSTSRTSNVLQFFDGSRSRPRAGLRAASSVTEPEHPYVERLVAARTRSGLRARLHPPGGRPDSGDRGGPAADRRHSTTGCSVQRVLGAVEDSATRDSAWTTV